MPRTKAHRYAQQTVPEAPLRVLSLVHETMPYRIIGAKRIPCENIDCQRHDIDNDARFRISGNAVHCCRVADWSLAALTLSW